MPTTRTENRISFPEHCAAASAADTCPVLAPACPAMADMPLGYGTVAGMDADHPGRKLSDILRRAVEVPGRGGLQFNTQEPSGFQDWGDVLKPCRRPTLVSSGHVGDEPA